MKPWVRRDFCYNVTYLDKGHWEVRASKEKRNDEWRFDDTEIPFESSKSIGDFCIVAVLRSDPSQMVQGYGDDVAVLKNKNKHEKPIHCTRC